MRKVLFIISIVNYHREVLPVVGAFRREGWQVIAVIGWVGQTADDALSEYAAMGCRVFKLPTVIAYRDDEWDKSSATETRLSRNWVTSAKRSLFGRLAGGVLLLLRQLKLRHLVSGYMEALMPDVVFQGPFHSCGRFDNAFARRARRLGILHCCYPVSAYHGRKTVVLARFNNIALGMLPALLRADFDLLNRFLAWAFPDWTQTRDGVTIFMWDPVNMLISRLTGLMEYDIWQKPSPIFDIVFVFNSFSRNLLEVNHFPMKRVVISGIPLVDVAIASVSDPVTRQAIFADLGLADRERFLLFNVEPSAEHHYCDWERHWTNFRTMMKVVTRQRLSVVLSLHPLCRLEDYLFAEQEFGVHVSRAWKIYDLYPLCAGVVSFPCSTNLIAETFDKPLVIYDFFGLAGKNSPRAWEFRLPNARIGHDLAQVTELVLELSKESQTDDLAARKYDVFQVPTFETASNRIIRRVYNLLTNRSERGPA
jgi:hypothetical protein